MEGVTLTCRSCEQEKPASEFPRNRNLKSGRHTYCKHCHNERGREWNKKNPDRRRSISRAWREKNESYSRSWHLQNRYGMTEGEYQEMLTEQGGVCMICEAEPSTARPLVVDHSHDTGSVRGLLCDFCNTALGKFGDDTGRLRSAIRYLERYEKP